MVFKEATIEDWIKSRLFFSEIYRENHPLLNKNFWEWQYGDTKYGRSFICLNEEDKIVGHIGIGIEKGYSWMLNAHITEEYRGKGIMNSLFDQARAYGPLAATGASEQGLKMFKGMNWIRYYDLLRFVKINPKIKKFDVDVVCDTISVSIEDYINKDSRYFNQPGIKGIKFLDGSTAVSQEDVGGLRVVDIVDLDELEKSAWDLGYLWIDYLTSWNDFKITNLEKNNWSKDAEIGLPWLLNPIVKNSFYKMPFLSEYPLDRKFVVHRSCSDHGRVGSL